MAYIITLLHLSGDKLPPAEIRFKEGLNVITGPSDTGKTYIYECINYMLGSSAIPKEIKEVKGYTKIFLELLVDNSKLYTLQSDLKGGNFKVYDSSFKEITNNSKFETLKRKHNTRKDDNISTFLLGINNLNNKYVRTKKTGEVRGLSYRDVVKYILVDETRILSDKSVIRGNQVISHTSDDSTFKLLLTGYDDSDLVAYENKNDINYSKGRAELLDELIKQTQLELQESVHVDDNLLDTLEVRLINERKKYSDLLSLFRTNDNRRKETNDRLELFQKEKSELKEILYRSSVLNEHYRSDISRLEATIEASILLKGSHTLDAYCSLCKNPLNSICQEDDIISIIDSCTKEIDKIQLLLAESIKSRNLIDEKLNRYSIVISKLEESLKELNDTIENDISIRLSDILRNIDIINNEKNDMIIALTQSKRLSYLFKLKDELSFKEQINKVGSKDITITTALLTTLCEKMRDILLECKYPKGTSVGFSESKLDFVISGQDRRLSGKGSRAIIYSIFIYAFNEMLTTKNYSIGVPILDSPLLTYKETKANEEVISFDLAMDFYRYAASISPLKQSIIIENEEPPSDVESVINHIKFSKLRNQGRYGFIPIL
ncbi:hypothetical protein [Spirosoma sp.]|uniref:hypothetical protein n=1 Tax=Spirosoma sp. TaxID=1899569 RepID=UPI00261B4420|nr:hypothetical protein [Spirosoma sp.]MCX6218305.1 hypothetical protein [Spirosoma sp.]